MIPVDIGFQIPHSFDYHIKSCFLRGLSHSSSKVDYGSKKKINQCTNCPLGGTTFNSYLCPLQTDLIKPLHQMLEFSMRDLRSKNQWNSQLIYEIHSRDVWICPKDWLRTVLGFSVSKDVFFSKSKILSLMLQDIFPFLQTSIL